MQSTTAKIVLDSDSSATAQISIVRDDSGNQTWPKWGGSFSLLDGSGTWTLVGDGTLGFAAPSGGDDAFMTFNGVPSNFLDVFCTKTMAGTGATFIWSNGNPKKDRTFRWVIWTGCV
jgi:hypothetical protein